MLTFTPPPPGKPSQDYTMGESVSRHKTPLYRKSPPLRKTTQQGILSHLLIKLVMLNQLGLVEFLGSVVQIDDTLKDRYIYDTLKDKQADDTVKDRNRGHGKGLTNR